jgi:hypothetical protein
LIGKSVPQLIKDSQYELNETRSLRMQNFKLLIKLLFKYKRDAGIDLGTVQAQGGNAMPYDDNPNDLQPIDIPNMVGVASMMSNTITQDMQQIVGATDYVMGVPTGAANETSSGIRQMTEQALFKFSMMVENIYDDLLEFINFVIILMWKYDSKRILLNYPQFKNFFESQSEDDLENTKLIDITIKDLSARRDVARAQFINASNIILPTLQGVGGNVKEYLRQVMDRLDMENVDDIINPPPEAQNAMNQIMQAVKQNPQLGQLLQALMQDQTGKLLQTIIAMLQGGGAPQGQPAQQPVQSQVVNGQLPGGTPEETATGVMPEVR